MQIISALGFFFTASAAIRTDRVGNPTHVSADQAVASNEMERAHQGLGQIRKAEESQKAWQCCRTFCNVACAPCNMYQQFHLNIFF